MALNKFFKFNKGDNNNEKLLEKLKNKIMKDKKVSAYIATRLAEKVVFKPTHLEKIRMNALQNIGLRPGVTFYFDQNEEIKLLAKYFNVNFSVMGVNDSTFLLNMLRILEDKVGGIVGYDLDGVICDSRKMMEVSYRKLNGEQRREYIRQKIEHYKTAKVLNIPVEKEFYIITGRGEKYEELTRAWLKKNNIKPVKLFINKVGGRAQDHIAHKIEKIKELKITKYYEDSKRIYNGIKKACQHTDVILITGCKK